MENKKPIKPPSFGGGVGQFCSTSRWYPFLPGSTAIEKQIAGWTRRIGWTEIQSSNLSPTLVLGGLGVTMCMGAGRSYALRLTSGMT